MKLLSCPAWRVLLEGKLEKLENRLDAESGDAGQTRHIA